MSKHILHKISNSLYLIYICFFSFHSALVWGGSVKHQPQKVGREHELIDEDVVQIIKK